ncbi:hypothetical protein L596_015577 [Steinernema carpocapsae]|uniref:Ubiquitin-like protease family profile domain-containing protein n=1 Tax=Steinernema carpocapsae TaxID=34508 RepID=A0A4U5NG11_STECR|nr:hypothetical protein L596_015577 [Steinernema carpocapsae]
MAPFISKGDEMAVVPYKPLKNARSRSPSADAAAPPASRFPSSPKLGSPSCSPPFYSLESPDRSSVRTSTPFCSPIQGPLNQGNFGRFNFGFGPTRWLHDDVINRFCDRLQFAMKNKMEGMLAMQYLDRDPEDVKTWIKGEKQVLQVLLDTLRHHYFLVEYCPEAKEVLVYDSMISKWNKKTCGVMNNCVIRHLQSLFGHLFEDENGEQQKIPVVVVKDYEQQSDGWSCGYRASVAALLRAHDEDPKQFSMNLDEAKKLIDHIDANSRAVLEDFGKFDVTCVRIPDEIPDFRCWILEDGTLEHEPFEEKDENEFMSKFDSEIQECTDENDWGSGKSRFFQHRLQDVLREKNNPWDQKGKTECKRNVSIEALSLESPQTREAKKALTWHTNRGQHSQWHEGLSKGHRRNLAEDDFGQHPYLWSRGNVELAPEEKKLYELTPEKNDDWSDTSDIDEVIYSKESILYQKKAILLAERAEEEKRNREDTLQMIQDWAQTASKDRFDAMAEAWTTEDKVEDGVDTCFEDEDHKENDPPTPWPLFKSDSFKMPGMKAPRTPLKDITSSRSSEDSVLRNLLNSPIIKPSLSKPRPKATNIDIGLAGEDEFPLSQNLANLAKTSEQEKAAEEEKNESWEKVEGGGREEPWTIVGKAKDEFPEGEDGEESGEAEEDECVMVEMIV